MLYRFLSIVNCLANCSEANSVVNFAANYFEWGLPLACHDFAAATWPHAGGKGVSVAEGAEFAEEKLRRHLSLVSKRAFIPSAPALVFKSWR